MGADAGNRGDYAQVPPAPPWATPAGDDADRAADRRRVAGRRRALAVVLLVVGCLAAPLALCAAYLHTAVMDADGYVAAVTPVAAEPAVREALAAAIADGLTAALDEAGSTSLPGELGSLAGGVTGALPLDQLTARLTKEVLQSSAFEDMWREANRAVHPLLVGAVERAGANEMTTDPVPLDLSAVGDTVLERLEQAGLTDPGSVSEKLRGGRIPVFDSLPLQRLGRVIVALDRLWILLAALAVGGLAAGVALASDRLRAAAMAGAGLMVAMAVLEAGLAAARGSYLDVTDRSHIPRAASAAVFDIMTRSLRIWGWTTLVLGAVTVAACVLVAWGLSRRPVT